MIRVFDRAVLLLVILSIFAGKSLAQTTKTSNGDDDISYAKGVFQKIKEKNHFVTFLSEEDLGTLPIGLVKEYNGQVYVIAIDSARITPDRGATFSAYFQATLPTTNTELVFGAKNIAFNPGGIGLSSSSKLVLLKDIKMPLSETVDLSLQGDGSTYAEWDCNGFKSINLHGEVAFDPGLIMPEDPHETKVKFSFEANIHDIHNIMFTANIPAFKIKKAEDFSLKVKNMVVDWSDVANPAGLIVTSDMLTMPENPMTWRGFYFEEVEVSLAPQLSAAQGRPKLVARNFYLDDQGVSGSISAENIVRLGDASAGGWPLSIDKIGISFSKNKLNGGELGGLVRIGFLGDDPLRYNAMLSMRNNDIYYNFSLATTVDKEYNFFAGKLTINKNSRLQVAKTEKDFLPSAILNGKMTLNKGLLNLNEIAFQDLTLSTQRPYLHSGTFAIGNDGNSKVADFPVGFDNLEVGLSGGKVGIGGTFRLNFMNSSDKGFTASSSFIVTASQKEETQTAYVKGEAVSKTTSHWQLDKVTINDINLDVKVTAFELKGVVTTFDQHPVYGKGFRGYLDFSIPGPIPKAKATAYFGSKDTYRYWHVDAYVGATIPLSPALKISGLMGGMSYHMERPPQFDPYAVRNAIDQKGGMPKDLSEIFQYVPSSEAGLGFMGGVSIATKVEKVLNANVALEVQFGTNGGFRYAQFDGAGYIMHEAQKANNKQEANADESAPIWAKFLMRYDKTNSTFDANIKTYVNLAGGVVKGIQERGLVGEAALHIAPDDWWFYVGRPSQMFGLNVLGLAEIKTYFMMGTRVEDMPPLPPEVNEVFDNVNTNFMAMENTMSTGKGFGFGAHFRTGFRFDFGVYGEFAIGAGADILLRDYGEARCKGSNSAIGFNGWYASGQAYAFLKGDVGIRVRVFGRKRGFSIARLSAAVLLQAKLPNPSWFRGMVGVKYSILGGLITGKANIKIELGSQCEIVGAKEINIQVISDIKPEDKNVDISVFATPQVAFNMPVDKAFDMMNEFDEVATYRIKLDKLTLTDDKNTEIKGAVETDAEGMSASLLLRDILPPTTKLTTFASIHIEKKNGESWTALKNGSSTDYETKSAVFVTGEAPDYIPWENVAYAYPVKRQYNFYPQEYGSGYIKLKRGQPYLFAATDAQGKKWKVTASFNPAAGEPAVTSLNYDEAQTQVNFPIPQTLSKQAIYTFQIRRTSLDGESGSNNIKETSQTTVEDGDTTTLRQTALKGTALSGVEKELIANSFRTSMYGTFKEKIDATTNATDAWDITTNYMMVIGQNFDGSETFDKFELLGDNSFSTKPLVALKAGTDNSWLKDNLMPFLYNDYPFNPSVTFDDTYQHYRDGVAPLYAVNLYNNDKTFYQLEDGAISEGHAPSRPGSNRFMYYVGFVANSDYHDLLNKAARCYLAGGSGTAISRLLTGRFPDLIPNQYYPVELQYRLPGTNAITSTVVRKIYFK